MHETIYASVHEAYCLGVFFRSVLIYKEPAGRVIFLLAKHFVYGGFLLQLPRPRNIHTGTS